MSKIIFEHCKTCNKTTNHRYKRKHKKKPKAPDLNLKYCMECRTDYNKQLLGRNRPPRSNLK